MANMMHLSSILILGNWSTGLSRGKIKSLGELGKCPGDVAGDIREEMPMRKCPRSHDGGVLEEYHVIIRRT